MGSGMAGSSPPNRSAGLRDGDITPNMTSEPSTSVLRATLPASEDRAGLGRSRFTAYVSRSRLAECADVDSEPPVQPAPRALPQGIGPHLASSVL